MENIVSHNPNAIPFAPTSSTVIESVREVPNGYLLSRPNGEFPMPDEWREQFAVMRHGNTHYLICSTSAHASTRMFELRRQMLATKTMDHVIVVKATDEVVKLIYHENTTAVHESEIDRTDLEWLANEIINAAADMGASDIHIESRVKRANVYFRVNGVRVFYRDITADTAHSLGVVLYSVHADAGSKSTSWDPLQVMDGSLEWPMLSGRVYQLRFSSSPIHPAGGFQIVIRLLSMEVTGMSLEALGYSPEQRQMLDIMTSGSSGMVILCGPTNSGKSTTLQGVMASIYAKRGDTIKMITVEDPVEYVIPGACQISVARNRVRDQQKESSFTTVLRGTLRQDPDVVMVGEIRDNDSAAIVKDLVLAGRKLMVTLHASSALWAYVRLREIGVPWHILTMPGFIAGIIYQRLVPTLCQHCAIRLEDGIKRVSKEILFRIQQVSDFSSDTIMLKGDGCSKCSNTGISGRTVVAEFVMPDRTLLRYMVEEKFLEAEKYWLESGVGSSGSGGVTALASGIAKMRKGLVSPVDIEDNIGLLTADMVNSDSMMSGSEIRLLSGQGRY